MAGEGQKKSQKVVVFNNFVKIGKLSKGSPMSRGAGG
jgi:hypothetical protein